MTKTYNPTYADLIELGLQFYNAEQTDWHVLSEDVFSIEFPDNQICFYPDRSKESGDLIEWRWAIFDHQEDIATFYPRDHAHLESIIDAFNPKK